MSTNPSVQHDPLSKWCIRLMLQTWCLVGISDRDDGCVSRLFFVRCFTAVEVDNYVTIAIIFLSIVRDVSLVYPVTSAPRIEQISVSRKNWSVAV